jgi:phytoene dehydrogenase-like protein
MRGDAALRRVLLPSRGDAVEYATERLRFRTSSKPHATRSASNINPIWTYTHVPHGYTGDATKAILGQIERFAPGFRDRIVACVARPTSQLPAYNPNYVGGDIITGANTERQVVMRPRIALDPYQTGIPGTFICSAASPPGAGAHGMCGYNAAASALRHLRISPETLS